MDIQDVDIGVLCYIKHSGNQLFKIVNFSDNKRWVEVQNVYNYNDNKACRVDTLIKAESNINIPDWKPNVNTEDIQTLSKAIDICFDSGNKELFSKLTRLKNKVTYYVLENSEKVECKK